MRNQTFSSPERNVRNTKSLGLALLDHIMFLAQLGVIDSQERKDYAYLIQAAMRTSDGSAYKLLMKKLQNKALVCGYKQGDPIMDVIALISANI